MIIRDLTILEKNVIHNTGFLGVFSLRIPVSFMIRAPTNEFI